MGKGEEAVAPRALRRSVISLPVHIRCLRRQSLAVDRKADGGGARSRSSRFSSRSRRRHSSSSRSVSRSPSSSRSVESVERRRDSSADEGRGRKGGRSRRQSSLSPQSAARLDHARGRCRPCRFYFSPTKCRRGSNCEFCHDASHDTHGSSPFQHRYHSRRVN